MIDDTTIYDRALNVTKIYNGVRYFRINNSGIDILFAIKTDINIVFMEERFYKIKIESDLYLLSSKGISLGNIDSIPERRIENWTLETQGYLDITSGSFGSSLFLPSGLEGYSIGKILLNQLIKIGKELFPHASISLTLAPSQPNDDNIERRDHFYDKFGFNLTYEDESKKFRGGSGYIDRIENLKTFTIEELGKIEEISIFKKVHEINQLQYDLETKTDANKTLLKNIRESWDENYKLKKYKYATYILSVIVVFLIGVVITLYMK